MGKFLHHSTAWIVLLGLLTTAPAMAEDRPSAQILADIKAVEQPKAPEDRTDRAAAQQYLLKRQKAAEQLSIFVGELFRAHPDAPELPGLILVRWQAAMIPGPKADALKKEIDEALATSKNGELVAQAAYVKTLMAFRKAGPEASPDELKSIAEEFVKRAPKDPRGALFLGAVASKTTDKAEKEGLQDRIAKNYPDSPVALEMAKERRVREAVGKPFEIAFTEAIKGGEVSSESLKGKVVIVDFWATWCGPCVGEMPNMKKLYAKYKDKGVEFIGVSLDRPRAQGGYDKLKEFVGKNQIEWPQYYEGKVSAGDFATNWGIQSIPTVFAIGADGKLATTEALGRLEELIPELLAQAAKAKKDEAKP
jgi:thiol-disulfide isomerase/thioredoxin